MFRLPELSIELSIGHQTSTSGPDLCAFFKNPSDKQLCHYVKMKATNIIIQNRGLNN